MTLLVMEGFDHVSSAGQMAGKTNGGVAEGSSTSTETRFGHGRSLHQTSSSHQVLWRLGGGAHETLAVGFAYRHSGHGFANFVALYGDSGTTNHLNLSVAGTTGILSLRRGTTELATWAAIPPSNWVHIQMQATLNDTAGSVQVWVDGGLVIDLADVDTRNGGTGAVFDAVAFQGTSGSGRHHQIDDVWVTNPVGPAPHNGLLGDCRVMTIFPAGTGFHSELSGSDGDSADNWELVAGETPNDSSYVGSDIAGQRDTYLLSALPDPAVDVLAVQISPRVAKTDAGAISGRRILRINEVDYTGSDVVMGSTFNYAPDLLVTNPATGLPWSEGQIAEMEAGWEVRPA